mgnify:CR=1 FL=1
MRAFTKPLPSSSSPFLSSPLALHKVFEAEKRDNPWLDLDREVERYLDHVQVVGRKATLSGLRTWLAIEIRDHEKGETDGRPPLRPPTDADRAFAEDLQDPAFWAGRVKRFGPDGEEL